MNSVTVLWSGAAAAGFLIAIVHTTIWINDRKSFNSLALALASSSLIGVAITELGMMMARSPAEWTFWVRWCHAPMFLLIVSLVAFVRLHFGTGRTWLIASIVVIRSVILVANFAVQPTFNFANVASIRTISFLGQDVTVLNNASVGPFQWLATGSLVLLVAYIVDASATAWRRNPRGRGKNLVVGSSLLIFVSFSCAFTQLVIWGAVQLPMLITPPFLILMLALGYDHGRETLRASQLARDLRQSDGWLGLAADAAELGLWKLDANRKFWATERSRILLGLGPLEPIDLDVLCSRVHADDAARVRQNLMQSVNSRNGYDVEFRITLAGQLTPRWISSQGKVECDADGHITLARGILRDVSDAKLAQAQAEELRSEVSHSGRVTMLGRLASALAHELCQPLAAILRNVEAAELMLARPAPNIEDLRAIVRDIHNDDQRAGDIIDRLRSLLKRRQMQFQPLSPESLLSDANMLVRADAAARHVALECRAQGPLPMISGDRVHLSQVLINLLQNGIDATCDSAETTRRVILSARILDQSTVEISVEDSGTGLAAEALGRLFEPFFTTKPGGMGMGLSVSRTIVEAHGGRLWAENQTQGGAIFRIKLPVMAEAA